MENVWFIEVKGAARWFYCDSLFFPWLRSNVNDMLCHRVYAFYPSRVCTMTNDTCVDNERVYQRYGNKFQHLRVQFIVCCTEENLGMMWKWIAIVNVVGSRQIINKHRSGWLSYINRLFRLFLRSMDVFDVMKWKSRCSHINCGEKQRIQLINKQRGHA